MSRPCESHEAELDSDDDAVQAKNLAQIIGNDKQIVTQRRYPPEQLPTRHHRTREISY